jgi:ATP-dependent DNA helicase RecQ
LVQALIKEIPGSVDPTIVGLPKHHEKYASLLSEKFGYPGLRPGQSEALKGLDTSDVLAVLPTGSGKSMAYVLPALVHGRVLVVSPHIALMQDQVESLVANGIKAAFINSNLTNTQKRLTYIDFRDGDLDLLFTSPESLANQRFVGGLAKAGINLLAIDEAHCVSEWGHTFRPDYLRLDSVRQQLGSPRTIALTATATDQARDDIAQRLGMDDAVRVVHSVDRPNLTFSVNFGSGNSAKQDFLIDYVTGRGACRVTHRCRAQCCALSRWATGAGQVLHTATLHDGRHRRNDRHQRIRAWRGQTGRSLHRALRHAFKA